MKKVIILLGTALLLASCETETVTKLADTPYIALSPSSITVEAGAVSSYTINYAVSNPADNAVVSVTGDAAWLSILDSSVSGQARFSIAENTSDNLRAGTITVSYTYNDKSRTNTVTAKAAVVQYGANDPVLNLDPNVVEADYSGGIYSFSYSIDNPVDGEDVTFSTSSDWLSDINHTDYGNVNFTVTKNGTSELRYGTVTVSYAGIQKEVSVIQSHEDVVDDIDITKVLGTYTASGDVYDSSAGTAVHTEWTLKIFEFDAAKYGAAYPYSYYDIFVDGLSPQASGWFETLEPGYAVAGYYSNGRIVIPSQMLYYMNNGYYLLYTPCVRYEAPKSFYYNTEFPEFVFTLNEATDEWFCEYGAIFGGATNNSLTTCSVNFDCVAPGITFKKVSDATSLSTDSKRTDLSINHDIDLEIIMID